MRFGLVLVFLMVLLTPVLPVFSVSAQDTCEAELVVTQMNLDLATYGQQVLNLDGLTLNQLAAIYAELVELRHRYEDTGVCADLDAVNDLMIQLIAEMEDVVALEIAVLADPDNAVTYQNFLTTDVFPRNETTYSLFLNEIAKLNAPVTVSVQQPPTTTTAGSSNDSVPIGNYYNYRDGQLRIVSVTDPYYGDGWLQPREGNRAIALRLELVCTQPREQVCRPGDVTIAEMRFSDGTIYEWQDMITLVSGDEARFYNPGERISQGSVHIGYAWLEIPTNAVPVSITFFDWTILMGVDMRF